MGFFCFQYIRDNGNKMSKKNEEKFYCECCHYYTSSKKDYNKHILTRKHKLRDKVDKMETMETQKSPYHICDWGSMFMSRGGIWKHMKSCPKNPKNTFMDDITIDDTKNMNNLTKLVLVVFNKKRLLFTKGTHLYFI